MAVELITTKITPDALRSLRFIAGANGELQYAVLERLLKAEEERLLKPVARKIARLEKRSAKDGR